MNDQKEIPEGYELKTDMFGLPYLQRKATPLQERLSRLLFVPALLAIVALIVFISL